MSNSVLQHMTWDAYCNQVGMSHVLTQGANACYAAKTSKPEAFLAQYFKGATAADVVERVDATEVLDGNGGYTLRFVLGLASSLTVQATMPTSPILGLHPSTARKLTFSTLSRAHTPLAAAPTAAPTNAKDAQVKPKVLVPPAQRFDTVARVVSTAVALALSGKSVVDQQTCDDAIVTADGTSTLSTILAPTAAALSMAIASLGATVLHTPLYRHIAALGSNIMERPCIAGVPAHLASSAFFMPRPVISIIGTEPRHMGKVRIREVCLIPMLNAYTTSSAAAAVEAAASSPTAGTPLAEQSTQGGGVGSVAAFSPKLLSQIQIVVDYLMTKLDDPPTNPDGTIKYNGFETALQAVELIEEAIRESGCGAVLGTDIQIGLVVDGALCFRAETGKYAFLDGTEYTGAQLAEALAQLCKDKKVAYIEDALHENDTQELRRLMHRIGATTVVAGNHIFAGDRETVVRGASQMIANNMVLRLSDAGTLSQALSVVQSFLRGYPGASITVMAESNEAPDVSGNVADIAVGVGARFVRIGGILRSEHTAILARLLAIQSALEETNLLVPPPRWDATALELPPAPLEPVADLNAKDAKKKK